MSTTKIAAVALADNIKPPHNVDLIFKLLLNIFRNDPYDKESVISTLMYVCGRNDDQAANIKFIKDVIDVVTVDEDLICKIIDKVLRGIEGNEALELIADLCINRDLFISKNFDEKKHLSNMLDKLNNSITNELRVHRICDNDKRKATYNRKLNQSFLNAAIEQYTIKNPNVRVSQVVEKDGLNSLVFKLVEKEGSISSDGSDGLTVDLG
jgi:hypothetical protein